MVCSAVQAVDPFLIELVPIDKALFDRTIHRLLFRLTKINRETMRIVIEVTVPLTTKEPKEWPCQSTCGLQNLTDGAAAHDGVMTYR